MNASLKSYTFSLQRKDIPMLNAKVASLPDGTMGFDTTTPLNLISARQFLNKGYGFVVRYIGRGDGSKTFTDITQDEGQAIVDAGLGLCLVQHPLAEGWSPTGVTGKQFGAAAASLAGGAGLLAGSTVWLDCLARLRRRGSVLPSTGCHRLL
jgi:hypothetical protein